MNFVIHGTPLPLKRARFSRNRVYNPSKKDQTLWKQQIEHDAPLLNEPLTVSFEFVFSRPKSHYRTGRFATMIRETAPKHHTTKPDVDNLIKFCLDAMNNHVYEDDKLVVSVSGVKRYAKEEEQPHTQVILGVC